MTGCSAINCSNSSRTNFRLFVFPTNAERRAKWIQNTRRDQWTPSKNARLCEVHFEDSQYENHRADGLKKLKPNAIPTLFDIPNPPPMKKTAPRKSLYKYPATNPISSKVDKNKPWIIESALCELKELVENREIIQIKEPTPNESALTTVHSGPNELEHLRQENKEFKHRIAELEKRIKYLEDEVIMLKSESDAENKILRKQMINMMELHKNYLNEAQIENLENGSPLAPLHTAAKQSNSEALVHALCQGANPAAADRFGDTALHCAVRYGNAFIAELLIAAGACVDAVDASGATPLAVASGHVDHGHVDVVEVLLKKGAQINHVDREGRTPLIHALAQRNVQIATLLVEKGASVDTVDSHDDCPLVVAARNGLVTMLPLLMQSSSLEARRLQAMNVAESPVAFMMLKNAAPVGTVCYIRLLPRVAKMGWQKPVHTVLSNCLEHNCHLPHHNKYICRALMVAGTARILLTMWRASPASTRQTALQRAASEGWMAAVLKILMHWRRHRGSFREIDAALLASEHERSAVVLIREHKAIARTQSGRKLMWRAAERGWCVALRLLIALEASVNAVHADGRTLLHCAVCSGNVACVKVLLENGAVLSRVDDDGRTPLHMAADSGCKEVVAELLAAGADPFGLSPCDVTSSESVTYMLQCDKVCPTHPAKF